MKDNKPEINLNANQISLSQIFDILFESKKFIISFTLLLTLICTTLVFYFEKPTQFISSVDLQIGSIHQRDEIKGGFEDELIQTPSDLITDLQNKFAQGNDFDISYKTDNINLINIQSKSYSLELNKKHLKEEIEFIINHHKKIIKETTQVNFDNLRKKINENIVRYNNFQANENLIISLKINDLESAINVLNKKIEILKSAIKNPEIIKSHSELIRLKFRDIDIEQEKLIYIKNLANFKKLKSQAPLNNNSDFSLAFREYPYENQEGLDYLNQILLLKDEINKLNSLQNIDSSQYGEIVFSQTQKVTKKFLIFISFWLSLMLSILIVIVRYRITKIQKDRVQTI